MSKSSLTSKTEKFLSSLDFVLLSEAQKVSKIEVCAGASVASVRAFLKNFQGNIEASLVLNDFRFYRTTKRRSGNRRTEVVTVYRNGSLRRLGWMTITWLTNCSYADVVLENEF